MIALYISKKNGPFYRAIKQGYVSVLLLDTSKLAY